MLANSWMLHLGAFDTRDLNQARALRGTLPGGNAGPESSQLTYGSLALHFFFCAGVVALQVHSQYA
jgi:hypothetical protein